MTTLRLHTGLYPEDAVTRAATVFSDYGHFELATEGTYLVVRVSANQDVDEQELAGELANHALVNAIQVARVGNEP